METARYFAPHTLARLLGLKLRARHVVEGFVAGLHRSPQSGWSVEFAEHREYTPGDDLRYVDWKLFGRTDKHYIKRFEDETNLIGYLALDVSASMMYRGPDAPLTKLEYGQTLVAALAWLILRQQDAIALATIDSAVRAAIRPGMNASQIEGIVNVLEHLDPTQKTSLGPALADLAQRWNRRGVVILVTDGWEDAAALLGGIGRLRAAKHEVILWHLVDRAELEFPFRGPLQIDGLEGESPLDVDAEHVRSAYCREVAAHCKTLEVGCRSRGADYLRVVTDEPLDRTLSHYLARRLADIR